MASTTRSRRPARVGALAALGALAILVLGAAPVSAHPLGNFTVNTYSGLRIQPDRVVIDMVIDMAEIPTAQAKRTINANGDGKIGDDEASAYAGRACPELIAKLTLRADGRAAPLRSVAADITFPPGAAGLSTLRLTCALVADTGELRGDRTFDYQSEAYTDRVGWREVTAVGDQTTLVSSDVKPATASGRLTAYPVDLLSSPLDQRKAKVRARPGGPAAPEVPGIAAATAVSQPRGIDAATRSFTALVARRQLSLGFGVLAMALAIGLGAIHAFAPGHGKTMIAAYLVGQRGTLRQAALIGLTVTTTHTIGVLGLGILLSASTTLAPESLYPWLGLTSGLMLAALGASLLARAVRHRPLLVPDGLRSDHIGARDGDADHHALDGAHDDDHVHDDGHHHNRHGDGGGHDHGEENEHHHGGRSHRHPAPTDGPVQWRTLVPLGLAGGVTPSPSAIVVLLGAIALGRAWFGVVLVVGYGLGMAVTLTGAGLLLVGARDSIEHRFTGGRSRWVSPVAAALPVLTAAVIIVGGLYLTLKGAAQL